MVGTSLNLISMGLTSQAGHGLGLNLQTNQLGANLGNLLQLQASGSDGFSFQQFAADAAPYVAGGLAVGVLAGAGIYALRRWRERQAALPPPGMTDVRPEQLKSFFETAQGDERSRSLLLGYSHTALDETLTAAERRLASEIADLKAALDAPHNDKTKKRISEAIDAYEDVLVFTSLRLGRTVRVRHGLPEHPGATHAAAVKRLAALENHRLVLIAQYFQNMPDGEKSHGYRESTLPDITPVPKLRARYAALDERQRRQLHLLALRTWQELAPEDKDAFWELRQKGDDLRGTTVAPDFLALFTRLVPNPRFPMQVDDLAAKLGKDISERVAELRETPALPADFRNVPQGILFLRSGERMMGNIRIVRRLGAAAVRIAREVGTGENKKMAAFDYAPDEVLTMIGDEKSANTLRPRWEPTTAC
jgi:hypothetical protein